MVKVLVYSHLIEAFHHLMKNNLQTLFGKAAGNVALTDPELQTRQGIEDNSEIIFLIPQRKYML